MDVGGDVGCGAGLMVAASGESDGEEQREETEAHSALISIVALGGFWAEKIWGGESLFYQGLAGKLWCRGWFFDGENVVVGW